MFVAKRKKIGNSFYILIPKDITDEDLIVLTNQEYQDLNKENKEELEFVKQTIQNREKTMEELLNRVDYLENKLDLKNTYRNEKVDLQKFYEDMMLFKNTFFKFKKEMGK